MQSLLTKSDAPCGQSRPINGQMGRSYPSVGLDYFFPAVTRSSRPLHSCPPSFDPFLGAERFVILSFAGKDMFRVLRLTLHERRRCCLQRLSQITWPSEIMTCADIWHQACFRKQVITWRQQPRSRASQLAVIIRENRDCAHVCVYMCFHQKISITSPASIITTAW